MSPQEKDRTTFGEWLSLTIQLSDLTQSKLADLSGVDGGAISRIISGERARPRLEIVESLLRALKNYCEQNGIPMLQEYEEGFLNSAGYASEQQMQDAQRRLSALQDRYKLQQKLYEAEGKIAELEKEKKDLEYKAYGNFRKKKGGASEVRDTDAES